MPEALKRQYTRDINTPGRGIMDQRALYGVCAPVEGRPADVDLNTASALERVAKALSLKADILVLPRLCLTSASCGDLFGCKTLLNAAASAALRVAAACTKILCVFGLPLQLQGGVYDVCAVAMGGRIMGFVPAQKAGCLSRAFAGDLPSREEVSFFGQRVPFGKDLLFPVPGGSGIRLGVSLGGALTARAEADRLSALGAHIMAFPSAEKALALENALRRERILNASGHRGCVCLYANAGVSESTTDAVYDGQAVIAGDGALLGSGIAFSGNVVCARFIVKTGSVSSSQNNGPKEIRPACEPRFPYVPEEGTLRDEWCADAMEICAHALSSRLQRSNARGAVVGVSGGVDSALALLIASRALLILGQAPESLTAVTMPGPGTTGRTRAQAEALTRALELELREISITDSVFKHLQDIGHPEGVFDAAYENAQARERTQVLMDIANMEHSLVVGAVNMSELALGFTTFGGDHLSMYAVNAGLYKTAVRMILRWFAAREGRAVGGALHAILQTPVSPELLPPEGECSSQLTEDILGPYELLDFFLHHFLSSGAGPRRLFRLAREAFGDVYAEDELTRRLEVFFRRFFASQFKRSCIPDGPQVFSHSLSPRGGLSMPSDASAALWLAEVERLKAGVSVEG